jgi:hypothetical protein
MENPILGGGYTCSVCGKYQRTSTLCNHSNLIPTNIENRSINKEDFYKYGESLGIKINDLQRLKMLADICNDRKYTEEDMLKAAKYGYEFRDTTSFPEHKFEDSCINNTKQWINSLNKQD